MKHEPDIDTTGLMRDEAFRRLGEAIYKLSLHDLLHEDNPELEDEVDVLITFLTMQDLKRNREEAGIRDGLLG